MSYLNRSVELIVDSCDMALGLRGALGSPACAARAERLLEQRCSLVTETCHRFLDLTGPLQVGGLPSLPSANFPVRGSGQFLGCVRDLRVDHRLVDLDTFVADNGSVAGCPEKRPFCAASPCEHGATCRELWVGFACDCLEGFAGPRCTEAAEPPWRFRGDGGHLGFNPLLKPIQLPWLLGLSLRTRQKDDSLGVFLASVQIGQNSSVSLRLGASDGRLVAALDGVDVAHSRSGISDGKWHRVELVWQTGQVSLDLDYRGRPTISPISAKLQGLYVGRILLGGPGQDASPGLVPLDGCIQVTPNLLLVEFNRRN